MERLFGWKMVPAPWMGEGKMVRRIDLRDALRTMGTLGHIGRDGVFWCDGGNSYVMVAGEDYWHPKLGKVDVYSINGCGEVRWHIGIGYTGEPIIGPKGDRAALIAFGLIDAEVTR